MSASSSELKIKLSEDDIQKIIKEKALSFLVFELSSRPTTTPEEWFMRRSSNPARITLGLLLNNQPMCIRLTTSQLDQVLAGEVLPGIGRQLKLADLIVPKKAMDCIIELNKAFSRIYVLTKEDDEEEDVHDALKRLVIR